MVSISTRFITWDLSTSDLQRDVNPGIEGIMQQLILSPDNKWAAAYTNNNQSVLLNMLSSEFVIIENPFEEGEQVTGVFLLNQKYDKGCRVSKIEFILKRNSLFSLYINTKRKWTRYDMRGKFLEQTDAPNIDGDWEILCMFASRSPIKFSATLFGISFSYLQF